MENKTVVVPIPEVNYQETDITIRKILLTPQLAEALLQRNIKNNRKISESNVKKILADLKSDKWNPNNGNCITFDTLGRLVDGQHRLTAILRYGKTVTAHIMQGITPEGFITIDTGRKRNAMDMLKIEGFSYIREIPSMILRSEALLKGKYRLNEDFTNSQILELAKENKSDFEHACSRSCTFYSQNRDMNKTEYSALYRVFKKISYDDAETFFKGVATGINLDEESPMYILRKFLKQERDKAVSNSGRPLNSRARFGKTISAWNSWRTGEEIKRIKWREIDQFPLINGLDITEEVVQLQPLVVGEQIDMDRAILEQQLKKDDETND